jgi:hypothetical protein
MQHRQGKLAVGDGKLPKKTSEGNDVSLAHRLMGDALNIAMNYLHQTGQAVLFQKKLRATPRER